MKRKNYNELEFTDDFMFWHVLTTNPNLCKELLELVLKVKICKICPPENQKTIENTYDGKGIRLDVYVDDGQNTVYDLEMQTTKKTDLPKRMRYYQGMIDLNLIQHGEPYSSLKKSYIIFFCTSDAFGLRLPIYTFENICVENSKFMLNDEAVKIVINPDCDRAGLSKDMNDFLDLLQGKHEVEGLAKKLLEAVEESKMHKEVEQSYMTLLMKIQEERAEAAVEAAAEANRKFGNLMRFLISSHRNEDALKASMDEQFREKLYKELNIQ